MSSNQPCPECGLQDYSFMVVCSDCGALLNAVTTPEQDAYFDALPEGAKVALQRLTNVEEILYKAGIKDFTLVLELLTEVAYHIAFGTSKDDAWRARMAQFNLGKTKPQPFPTEAQ